MKKSFLSALMLIMLSIFAMSAKAETLTVTSNSNSGINQANCVATLSDGTILGFYCNRYGDAYAFFCGAISSAKSIVVPDKILDSLFNKEYNVISCAYFFSPGTYFLDFDEATSVTSLTLPSTITHIGSVPSSVSDLHLKSQTPPSLYSSSSISDSTSIWVPQSALPSYQSSVVNSYSGWYGKEVHYEGWEPKSITVTVKEPDTFAQELFSQVEQWSEVDELTVIGKFSDTDLGYLSRFTCATKIDLSQTEIKTIGRCAGLTMLEKILLPSTVVEVQEEAFNGCVSLMEICLPVATSIGSKAFYYCKSLSSVNLPAVTTIGNYAFYNCENLSSVNLPTVTTIGNYAFYYCRNLTSVSLPVATSIGYEAFYDCRNLTSVSLPAAISIGDYAFRSCSSLKSVTLPATLQSLGEFVDGYNLEDVYCYVVSPLNTRAFSSMGTSAPTLHVPALSVNSYILHEDWYKFKTIVALEDNVDKAVVTSDFTITELKGLAEKVDLSVLHYYSISQVGHLTVSTNDKWELGNYVQSQSYSSLYQMNYNSTTIPYTEMTADNVTVKYSVQTDAWNFISFPFDVNVSDIQCPEGTLWVIRKYSGEDRAKMTGNTWQNMTDGMILKAGEGYILSCTDGINPYRTTSIEFTFKAIDNSNKNNIFAYQDVTKPLSKYVSELAHNSNWNLVGNPYPCFYDTRNIEHNGVITVWSGGGYKAYSLLDDNYVLRPHEAFFVQCPTDATSMTFKAEGRQHTSEASNDASHAKAIQAANANNRQVFNLTLSGTDYTDNARVVINESAQLDYEISCDASKFMSSNTSVPQIYIIENGQKMSIDERPLSGGTIALGMYIGEPGDYAIGVSEAPADVFLTDNATGKTVNLSSETYKFSASKGTSDNRFTIQIGDATNVGNISAVELKQSEIFKISGQKISAPLKGINIINGNKILVK